MRGLDWQPLQLPLAAGVNQKADDRALPPPQLAAAIDVQFDEIGGLQTRKPYSSIGSTIAGGGTISTARRIVENGGEKVMFTKDGVYSWNDQLDRWVFRATHLAVSSEERTVHATPGDQYDCDRAELSGIVYHTWCDNNVVYVAATDKATGAVINAPTAVSGTATRPRLVALSTKVLLFWHAGTDGSPGTFYALGIDPTATDPATLTAALGNSGSWTTVLSGASSGARFDVCKVSGADTALWACRRSVTTSYTVATVTAGMTVTTSTKARVCDGPIAVASTPGNASVFVIRGDSTDVEADILTSALVDSSVGIAVGTVTSGAITHIAAAHRSVQNSSQYRCYCFWSNAEETDFTGWETKYNYVDTGSNVGSQAVFGHRIGIGSRAFDHDGSVYFWGVFAGESGTGTAGLRAQLQNTYFLWRDDGTLHAKAVAQRGGGLAPSSGRLPGVALTSGSTTYSWCANERRIIPIGTSGEHTGYAKRAPRDVSFTFDSNAARRCVRLGETLYVSGAEILQYDGVGMYEVGFHIYPWLFSGAIAESGNLPDGTYTYKSTWRWENAKGELDRSTTATSYDLVVTSGPQNTQLLVSTFNTTRKRTAQPPAIEIWRTKINPPDGAPFFLASSQDPTETSGYNRYIPNDVTVDSPSFFLDSLVDASLATRETNPENGDVLENLAPPGARVIAATDTRVFLGDVAGDPDRIWYSKLRQAGQVVSFHDALTFDVPKDGGDITGIAFQNGVCVVFRELATYMFPGDGFDNLGRGQNYGPPQVLSYDVGCRDTDSIVVTPEGIAFQSSKGKYLLSRGWTMQPIGEKVTDYDSETVLAAHVVTAQHQVRFLTASRLLVWDYRVNEWAEWTITSGVHAAVLQGTYHYLAAAGPLAEQTTHSATTHVLDVETAWIKPGDLQGAAGIRKLQLLGEYRGAPYVRVRVAYDYNPDWIDEHYLTVPASLAAGDPLQLAIPTSRVKLQSIKLRLAPAGGATQATMTTTDDVPLLQSGESPTLFWSATFTAIPLGTLGNGITLSIGCTVTTGATTEIDVRDHQHFDASTQAWAALADNVGIRVTVASTSTVVLISAIEAAINAYSSLLDVTTPHVGTAWLRVTLLDETTATVEETAGGAFGAAAGESLKLTGLGMEVGLIPRLHKRYPRI